ncbi:unnamed protein product [Dovyalis caffra]|uniref:Uncharacterized protein n=1 Tax=Dovyalis caffra TaxID=77055 RepID=A0AAV1RFW6_9ROSI|nr:unnamed protein product [Dovyalis caffra]
MLVGYWSGTQANLGDLGCSLAVVRIEGYRSGLGMSIRLESEVIHLAWSDVRVYYSRLGASFRLKSRGCLGLGVHAKAYRCEGCRACIDGRGREQVRHGGDKVVI